MNNLQLGQNIINQFDSFELILKKKGLKEKTIQTKLTHSGVFMLMMANRHSQGMIPKPNDISDIVYDYVVNGFFSNDIENLGTMSYRQQIYSNIIEFLNYAFEDMGFNWSNKLTQEQKDVLSDVSQNKFFKVNCDRNTNHTMQTKLIEELGIKVYFDEDNKPYVLSHELAETIGKRNADVNRDIRNLLNKIGQRNFAPTSKVTQFTMVEDIYNDCQNKEVKTYRIYKDLLLVYVLGLTGSAIIEFKMKYIDAFNYIEQEHTRLLKEHGELKDSFLSMFNRLRKENRDLLLRK